MFRLFIFYGLFFGVASVHAQQQDPSPFRLAVGVSSPELLHASVYYTLNKTSQLGAGFGYGPSSYGYYPTLNIEHRLYFGKPNPETDRKHWFTRQGLHYLASDEAVVLSVSVGNDFGSKQANRGWTADIGIWYPTSGEPVLGSLLQPAVRVQYYFYWKKKAV